MTYIKEPINFGLRTISQEFFQLLRAGFSGRDVISILGRSFVISSVSVAEDQVMPQANASFSEVTLPAWTGEGLPPVGTVCEIKRSANWTTVDVIAHYKGQAVIALDDDVELRDHSELRPIRTPEHIAAEERDERLVVMSHAYQDFTGESPSDAAYQAFRALDLAGYRKQVKP